MLSVGRELNINNKRVVCQVCSWEGAGAELSLGLAQVTSTQIYCCVYRCPKCGAFEVARKGKLLQFRPHKIAAEEDEAPVPKSGRGMS